MQGLVNANDFHILASNFGQVTTNGWEAGDFTYSGTVNANDFHLLAENFGQTASGEDVSMSASDWAALDAFEVANGLSVTSVPEPATLGLFTIASAGILARRRRNKV
jgi:PEP-CTERM motif